MLRELMEDIERDKKDYELSVSIYDDASDITHALANSNIAYRYGANYFRYAKNNGKKKYYEIVNKMFAEIPAADYYFSLQDDGKLCEDFFTKSISQWSEIKDAKKICMNILNAGTITRLGQSCWTNIKPVDKGNYFLSQWTDMFFMCDKRFFFEVGKIFINEFRWDVNKQASSGVGSYISNRLLRRGLNIYHTKKELVFHGSQDSLMNWNQNLLENIVVINLSKRKDRLAEMEKQSVTHGFKFERFEAKEAEATDKINAGHHGCFLSHKEILQRKKTMLVLEDDADLPPDFKEKIYKYLDQLPNNWDLFYLGGSKLSVTPYSENLQSVEKVYCTHAYIVRGSFCEKLLEQMKAPYKIDVLFSQAKGNIFIANPVLATQRKGWSDIENNFTNNIHLK